MNIVHKPCLMVGAMSEMRPTGPLGSDTSRFIIFQVRFPSLQLYSHTAHRPLTRITDFPHLKMSYDSRVTTNPSVNTAIAGHESVRRTISHSEISSSMSDEMTGSKKKEVVKLVFVKHSF